MSDGVKQYVQVVYDRAALSSSYYEFFKAAWHICEPAIPLDDNWHIRYLCWRLQQEVERIERGELRRRHIIINIPPRSLKSYLCTVMLNAWSWTRSPHLRYLTSSYSDSLSESHAILTKTVIESEWYQQRWGHKFRLSKKENRNNNFANSASGRRIATSVGGSATGKGANIIIADDLIDPRRAVSKSEREKAVHHATNTLYQRLNNPEVDVMIIVQQRLHQHDPAGYLMETNPDKWEVISIPAEDSYPIKPAGLHKYYVDGLFSPKRFSREVLLDKLAILGSRGYAEQYGQQPSDPEGNVFKRGWFRIMSKAVFEAEVMSKSPVMKFVADTAYDDKQKLQDNDPSGVLAFVHHDNTLYLFNYETIYAELPGFLRLCEAFVRANRYTNRSMLKIEPKASGKSIEQAIRAWTSINVSAAPAPTESKEVRATNTAPFVESGRVVLVEGTWNEAWLDSVCTFPNAPHDEEVDTLVMAINDSQKRVPRGPRAGAGSR
jgi:predicted phage terminase large subunit-like protein